MWKANLNSKAGNAMSNATSQAKAGVQRNPVLSSTLLYMLGALIAFGLLSTGLALLPWLFKPTYLLSFLLFLGLGVVHVWLMGLVLSWLDRGYFMHGLLVTVLAWLAGIGGMWLFTFFPIFPGSQPTVFISATLLFLVPYFCYEAFLAWNQIPTKIYKVWSYRQNYAGPDLNRIDLNQFMVVHFWMPRRFGESLFHDFSSKAPYEMRIGDLFQIFLDDYNMSKPEQAIQYLDSDGEAYGWVFYAKRPWWRKKYYYDPDYTFRDNFIRQGNIIVAKRVAKQ